MLQGIDVSHYQNVNQIPSLIQMVSSNGMPVDFIIAKASEGITYKDTMFQSHARYARSNGILAGAYHFARPDNNEPRLEVENFLSCVEPFLNQPMLLALDWENKSLNYDAQWALEWLRRVEDATGIKPLFYIQQSSVTDKYKCIAENDFGLWVARYNDTVGSVKPWANFAMWQRSSIPCDIDMFNGTKEALLKYATPIGEDTKTKCFFEAGDLENCPAWRFLNGME